MKSVVLLFFVFLLAFEVQHVACPSDGWLEAVSSRPHLAPLSQPQESPLSQPDLDDPCSNHTVACNPAGSDEARGVIIASSTVSFLLFFLPIRRILVLQPGPNEDNTLFWWSLCLGSGGYAVWWAYFSACGFLRASVFPILLVSIIGVVVHMLLTAAATYKTPTPRDAARAAFIILLPALCFVAAQGLKRSAPVQYTGWFGLTVTALSQSFRIASTEYRGDFNRWLFGAALTGSISGFLWLFHPQLCLSREYKITSYVIAVMRGTEFVVWSSRVIARWLGRIEGHAVLPEAQNNEVLQDQNNEVLQDQNNEVLEGHNIQLNVIA
ncbi:hypothetical protein ACP70R_036910 [Stipagrostis hirtigluma subsp. patula]